MKGVKAAQPLTEKGANAGIFEEVVRNSGTISSVGGNESRDTRSDANVQKGNREQSRKQSPGSPLHFSGKPDESGRTQVPTDP